MEIRISPAPLVNTHAHAYTHSIAHTTKHDSCAKLQKAVMREGDGNRVNRSEAAGTIGLGQGKNIFFDRKEGTQHHDRYPHIIVKFKVALSTSFSYKSVQSKILFARKFEFSYCLI